MRVCLLTPDTPRAGAPLYEHVRMLVAGGHDVTVALTDARITAGTAATVADAALVNAEVAGEGFDVAIATHWTTTARLFGIGAARHVYLVRTLEHERMGTWQAERFAAALSYDLPVDFAATAGWIGDALAELRPDARCTVVRDGVDRTLFAPAGTAGRVAVTPLRVLVDDRHALDRAASSERAALAACSAATTATFVEPEDDAATRAAKLRDADVVLHLPTGEGVLGLPLEGFVAGVTAVVTPARDQPELVEHGVNGLVAEHDDTRGAAGHLDRLADDAALLARLRDAAAEAGERVPTWEASGGELAAALQAFLAEDPPAAVRWPERLMSDAIAGAAVLRQELAVVGEELNRVRSDDLYRIAQRVEGRWAQVDGPVRPVAERVLARLRARLLR